VLAERRPALDRSSAVAVTLSIRYDDARLVCILCISRQTLSVIRCCTGSQQTGVTWSRGPVPVTSRAAAFCARWSGAIVDFGRPANTALQ